MFPKQKPSAKVSSIGVSRTQLYVQEDLKWLFREQPAEDFGIDAHAEVVEGDDVRGRLLALQIKSGESWFSEPTDGGWWFRPKTHHVTYWLNHSLPVIVVLYHPPTKTCYWQRATSDLLEQTESGGWRLLVPDTQTLDESARNQWRSVAEGDPYELRLRELRLARPWMQLLEGGTRLVVDFEEWINKSSGRGAISIGIDKEDGEPPEELVKWELLLGPSSYAEAVPKYFAWAEVHLHEETYDAADHELYEAECSIWDEGEQFMTQDYAGWHQGQFADGIRPFENAAGEVDYFRLELTLGKLGTSFLVVDEFAANGLGQLTR